MSQTDTQAAPAATDRRRPRILVADDERSMRELLAIVLRREGYDVVLAENGREAIALIEKEPIEKDIFPNFAAKWKREHGEEVRLTASFAGSETITNQILQGVGADVAILSIERDAQRLREGHAIYTDWRELPAQGVVNQSPFVIVVRRGNPRGPVQPLDLPDMGDIPLGQGNRIRFEDGKAIITTEIDGAPVGVRIDHEGIAIDGGPLSELEQRGRELRKEEMQRAREQAREAFERAREQAREAGRRLEEEARRRAEEMSVE